MFLSIRPASGRLPPERFQSASSPLALQSGEWTAPLSNFFGFPASILQFDLLFPESSARPA